MTWEAYSNIALALEKGISSHPRRLALAQWDAKGRESALDYETLGRRVTSFSAALRRQGVQSGDRVLLLVPMSIDLYVSMLAVIRMGAVCVFVDPHMGRRRFDACCQAVSPRAFIGIPKGHLFRLFCPHLRKVPLAISTGGLPTWLAKDMQALIQESVTELGHAPNAAQDALHRMASTAPGDPALITFTTGSSGQPKGSNRTHGFLAGQLAALDAAEKRACISNFPGFPILPLEDLAHGRTVYIPRLPSGRVREADPDILLAQLDKYKPAMMSGSPAYLEALADGALRRGRQLPAVELLYTGGAPITAAALEKLRRVWPKARIEVVYGSTEAEPVATLAAEEALGECRAATGRGLGCCVGYPVACIDILVLPLRHAQSQSADLAAEALPQGQVGEIVVRGPHVNSGYWNNIEAERAHKIRVVSGAAQGLWHRMGDAGYLDGRGRLWIVGRAHTAMANPRYQPHAVGTSMQWPWIFPYQAELIADAFPEVRKSAYLEWRGKFFLVVELKPSAKRAAGLENGLRQALGSLPLDKVVWHKALPVDARHNSKVEYARVKAWLEKRERA